METDNWLTLTSIAASALIAVSSLLINLYMHRRQQQREDEVRRDERERGILHREDAPRVEFTIDCRTYGPETGDYIVEFLLTASNNGRVQQKFKSILLRVRGVAANQPLNYWKGHDSRLDFPESLLDDQELVPRNYNFLFVEPGVSQTITYVTKIPASTRYILARAEFHYDEFTPHSAERVFRLTG